MPRALWLVLAAGVLVWAAAFFHFERPARPPAAARAEPEPAEPAARAVPVAAPASPPAAAPEPAADPVRPVVALAGPGQRTAPGGMLASAAASWRAARDSLIGRTAPGAPPPPAPDEVATGELGEGVLSPEYAALERAYVYEPRDGAWAVQQEQQLRAALGSSPLAQLLTIVNCQQTICRLVFERAPADAFRQLSQVRGLAEVAGVGPSTPYSYRSGQLSVYFTRRSAIVPSSP